MTDTPMTDKQIEDEIYFAVKLNIDCLPQLKGKGKVTGRDKIDTAQRILAIYLTKYLLTANVKFFRGPPAENHAPEGDWGQPGSK